MGTRQLRGVYGGNSRQAMARAIRAEIEGGEEILAAEQNSQMRMDHLPNYPGREQAASAARSWQSAHSRRVAAENQIRAKYGMPLRGDSAALPPIV